MPLPVLQAYVGSGYFVTVPISGRGRPVCPERKHTKKHSATVPQAKKHMKSVQAVQQTNQTTHKEHQLTP